MSEDDLVRRLPEVVTHNYDPDRGRFQNLCTLPDAEAEAILGSIHASGRRTIKPNYLNRRRRTEAWLLSERSRKLGVPPLRHPIYFFLGDMADGADPSRPASIVFPLSKFTHDMVTFTYPDSMASLPLGTDVEHAGERKPYHGQVFTLDELRDVVSAFGMPRRTRFAFGEGPDRFIEVQLWDDGPLRMLLNQLVNQSISAI